MTAATPLLISGFADEGVADKSLEGQLSLMASLGLHYVTIRFIDCGNGIRNVLDLDEDELALLARRLDEYGLKTSSIGSPLGKVLIADRDDGTGNRYVPFPTILNETLPRAIRAAHWLGAGLIRGFSFYPPRGEPIEAWLDQATDQIGQIAERCSAEGLTYGLEVEANLIGHSGWILRDIHARVGNPGLALVFDGANLVCQNWSPAEILEQFHAMLPGLGWIHIKDYKRTPAGESVPGVNNAQWIDEERLDRFVPAGEGDSGWPEIFAALQPQLPAIARRMQQHSVNGVFADLEPHLRGGGQFGGFSGPDGMEAAFRALCGLLDQAGIPAALRT